MSTQPPPSQCLKLTGTKSCPHYAGMVYSFQKTLTLSLTHSCSFTFILGGIDHAVLVAPIVKSYLSLDYSVDMGPGNGNASPPFNDVASFDKFISGWVESYAVVNCNNAKLDISKVRYVQTAACAIFVDAASSRCSTPHTYPYPCKEVYADFKSSLDATMKAIPSCSAGIPKVDSYIENLGKSSTVPFGGSCLKGELNEASQCGMVLRNEPLFSNPKLPRNLNNLSIPFYDV
jgi:hypothetical protein